ncbi:hypothetical protein FMEAI12_3550031 [Parafrankia sp. Ea1.12]|nr:hypothetical protein FMEAI12_3550031 [Parafrankia sp. Ea1.12]
MPPPLPGRARTRPTARTVGEDGDPVDGFVPRGIDAGYTDLTAEQIRGDAGADRRPTGPT